MSDRIEIHTLLQETILFYGEDLLFENYRNWTVNFQWTLNDISYLIIKIICQIAFILFAYSNLHTHNEVLNFVRCECANILEGCDRHRPRFSSCRITRKHHETEDDRRTILLHVQTLQLYRCFVRRHVEVDKMTDS